MSFKISNNLLYQLLFALCIGVPYLNIYELTFLVWVTTIFITLKQKYSLTVFQYVFPYVVVMIVGSFTLFFYESTLYEIIRDITYLVKPIIGIILGYQLCRSTSMKPMNTIVNVGLFIAIIHLILIFYNAIIHKVININVLREYSGYFSDYEVYALIIVIFHKEFEIFLSPKRFWLLFIIIGISSFLYLSRANFIQFALFYMALKGYFTLNKKTVIILATFVSLTLIGYAIIYNNNYSRHGKGLEALMYKIKNAPIEAFKTKVDKDDWQDFNDNFRSYENILTVKQVSQEGTFAIIAGKGFGATIDLGRKVRTNDATYVSREAILHNAFMTVFLKSGLIGVFFMVYFIYILMKQKKSEINMVKQINFLLVATGIFLIFDNWVLLGLFLKTEQKSIVIGFILCYRELIIRAAAIQHPKLNYETN